MRKTKNKLPASIHINVAPLVDVMMVLLIIFMVSASTMHSSIPVNLPKTQKSSGTSTKNNTVITINKKKDLYINGTQIKADQLIPKVLLLTHNDKTTIIQVRADKDLPYEKIFEIMNQLANNGYNRISLIAVGS